MYTGIYEDISKRTNGDIYAGVVGPVRTGKSTFIKKFMELAVIPNIENKYKKERAVDELPQSGSGKSIMTCEPKFVPNEAVKLKLYDTAQLNVRMIDCVGYMVNGAIGASEEGESRMVQTPWTAEAIPFEKAAEIGTKKVITDHSTIGIVVTTDGSFTQIPRSDYLAAEERVVKELKQISKPFVVILNTLSPNSAETQNLRKELEEKYDVAVIALDVINLTLNDVENLFAKVLYEFPVSEIVYSIPKWASMLSAEHWLNLQIKDFISSSSKNGDRLKNVTGCIEDNVCESFATAVSAIDLSCGKINTDITIDSSVFYRIVSDENGITVKNESDLFTVLAELLSKKKSTEILSGAISSAFSSGYGIVCPSFSELKLSSPEMYNDGGKFGISIKATAEALHVIKTEIAAEISPVIGAEAECDMFLSKLKDQYENAPAELWATEIFGRKLSEMLEDNIRGKLISLSEDTKQRMSRALTKISNTQKGGLFIFWI